MTISPKESLSGQPNPISDREKKLEHTRSSYRISFQEREIFCDYRAFLPVQEAFLSDTNGELFGDELQEEKKHDLL